jgi:hypothetical protein
MKCAHSLNEFQDPVKSIRVDQEIIIILKLVFQVSQKLAIPSLSTEFENPNIGLRGWKACFRVSLKF